jgi:predicted TIM-barrel fold metal-dependent hydrolase
MTAEAGIVDYLCNSFLPDRRALWDASISSSGVPVKVRRDPNDSFAEPEAMVARMDELGIATILMPTCDLEGHGEHGFDRIATRWKEAEALVRRFPGRFAALMSPDPTKRMAGVREARERLANPWVVGFYIHTHSWDRRFDHPDYYPYYALCSEFDVTMAMQAGTSGGLMPSECGLPVGIDRPAIYFPDVRFVLSHTGWPWVEETIAMALKFPNVYLGTGAYPPRHWGGSLRNFIRGPGRRKTIFGTNFPTVGHRHALSQISELELPEETQRCLLGDNARAAFSRLNQV